MFEWIPDWLKIGAAAVIGAGIKPFLEFVNKWRSTTTEQAHTSTATNLSLLQMSETVAKDYIGLFREATNELKAVREDSAKSNKHLQNAIALITKMLGILKQANYEGWEALENEAKAILNP